MLYDDRLATVLHQRPSGSHLARVQFRQLLDLLGTAPAEARGDLLDAAYLRLQELIAQIPGSDCAAMLAEPGLRLRSPRLLSTLAHAPPPVARTALHAAQLDEAAWLDLIPALPPSAWGMLWDRRDLTPGTREVLTRLGGGRVALPMVSPADVVVAQPATVPEPTAATSAPNAVLPPEPPAPSTEPAASPEAADRPSPASNEPAEEISAIVRRIEQFRRAREASTRSATATTTDAPRLPLGEEAMPPAPTSFDFSTDTEGRITSADSHIAPMTVGVALSDTAALDALIRHRQPIRGVMAQLAGAPAIAGQWQLDATPRFDLLGGRFTGYIGRFRRPAPTTEAAPQAATDSGTDRLRQSLHELRTPVNAIQGFAEIIQQQLFGPTPHEYRALAAVIAADAARMLAGFEELERFARIGTGAMEMASGESDLADCVCATLARLEGFTTTRGISLELEALARPMPLALAAIETERLCWRLLATLAATATPGETLFLRLRRQNAPDRPNTPGGQACLDLPLPAALADLSDEALFHASVPPADGPSAGMFGTGFTLRLAQAEARAAGGSLIRDGARLRLTLPGLTQGAAGHSNPQTGSSLKS